MTANANTCTPNLSVISPNFSFGGGGKYCTCGENSNVIFKDPYDSGNPPGSGCRIIVHMTSVSGPLDQTATAGQNWDPIGFYFYVQDCPGYGNNPAGGWALFDITITGLPPGMKNGKALRSVVQSGAYQNNGTPNKSLDFSNLIDDAGEVYIFDESIASPGYMNIQLMQLF